MSQPRSPLFLVALVVLVVPVLLVTACSRQPAGSSAAADPAATPVAAVSVPQPTDAVGLPDGPVAVDVPAATPTLPLATPTPQGCRAATLLETRGVAPGKYPAQYELSEYTELAGCMLTLYENPDIATLNTELNGTAVLSPLVERLPAEPLVIEPYREIGEYGGTLRGISKSPENGTADFLSTRHVNLVGFSDDLRTIMPNVARGWEYSPDFQTLTIRLRSGHRWSDGAPFTAEDIAFWYNDLQLNTELFPTVDSRWVFGGEPMQVEVIDPVTVVFEFAAPAPNFLAFLARTYIQPFQPKHVLSQYHIAYNPQANEQAQALGLENWTEVMRLYFHDWKDTYHPFAGPEGTARIIPTLESHVLVDESPNLRRYVANPYFHMIDTAGNQLPYISQHEELFSEDDAATINKLRLGEIDYKQQNLELNTFPDLKEAEFSGNYSIELVPTLGRTVYYAFNITHQEPRMAAIFRDFRFRQAMSLAIDRQEINEVVYLGQGVPEQALPADPDTVDFVPEALITQYTQYDPEQAATLLDAMGLTQFDTAGFRLGLDGEPLEIRLDYAPQGGPVQVHELVQQHWAAVGVRVDIDEVTSEFYRKQSAANEHDVATWTNEGVGVEIAGDTQIMVPPFGDELGTRTGTTWHAWMQSDGQQGEEPPEDVKQLYELAEEFKSYPLGSEDSNRVGEEIVEIHAKYLFSIGLVGKTTSPIYIHERLGNVGDFTIKAFAYHWAYPFRPMQWYIVPQDEPENPPAVPDAVRLPAQRVP